MSKTAAKIVLDSIALIEERGYDWERWGSTFHIGPVCAEGSLRLADGAPARKGQTNAAGTGDSVTAEGQRAVVAVTAQLSRVHNDGRYEGSMLSEAAAGHSGERVLAAMRAAAAQLANPAPTEPDANPVGGRTRALVGG